MASPVPNCYTTANSGATAVSSLDIDKPTSGSTALSGGAKNAAVGDLLIIVVGNDDNTATAQWDDSTLKPTGFTLIKEAGEGTRDCHVAAFFRIVDGTEGSTFSIPAQSSDNMWAYCELLSSTERTTPIPHIGATATNNTAGPSSALSITEMTTTVADCELRAVYAYDGGDAAGYTTGGTGWSEIVEVYAGTAPSGASGGVSGKTMSGTGATVACTVNPAFATTDGMVGFQFAIAYEAPLAVYEDTGTDGVEIGEGGSFDLVFNLPTEELILSDDASSALGASGTTYEDDGTDGVELSDDATPALTLFDNGSDGLELSDDSSVVLILATDDADGLELSDDSTPVLVVAATGADSIDLGDDSDAFLNPATVASTDGLELSDDASSSVGAATYQDDGTDGIELSDDADAVVVISTSGSDTINMYDAMYIGRTPFHLQMSIAPAAQKVEVDAVIPEHQVQLLDADGFPFTKSGLDVTASVNYGIGTIVGTTVVATVEYGRATFSNLTCDTVQELLQIRFALDGDVGFTAGNFFDITFVGGGGLYLRDNYDGILLGDLASALVVVGPISDTGADGLEVSEGGQVVWAFDLPYEGLALGDSASATVLLAGQTYPHSGTDGLKVADSAVSALGSPGGNTYGETGTEGLVLGDPANANTIEGSQSDGVVVSDDSGLALQLVGPQDHMTMADNATSALGTGLNQSGTDGIEVSESGTLVLEFNAPTEQVKISDTATDNVRNSTITEIVSDGFILSDEVRETATELEGLFVSDDTRLTIESLIPDEGIKLGDTATSAVLNVINSGTEGLDVSDASGTVITSDGPYDSIALSDSATTSLGGVNNYADAGTDGLELSDSATVTIIVPSGAIKVTGTDGIKLTDTSGVVLSGVQSPEGIKLSDSASYQVTGAWQETLVDSVKVSDVAGTTTTANGPYDSLRLTEYATESVRQRVIGTDGLRLSDTGYSGDEQFFADLVVVADYATVTVILGDSCLVPVPVVFTCIDDPDDTTVVINDPVITSYDCIDPE